MQCSGVLFRPGGRALILHIPICGEVHGIIFLAVLIRYYASPPITQWMLVVGFCPRLVPDANVVGIHVHAVGIELPK